MPSAVISPTRSGPSTSTTWLPTRVMTRSCGRPRRSTPTAAERSLESYRDEFPVLARKTYLISASLGPVSGRSRAYLDGYLDVWADEGAPDIVWMEHIFPR